MNEKNIAVGKRLSVIFVLLNFSINFIATALIWIFGIILYFMGFFSAERRTPAGILLITVIYTFSHLIGSGLIAFLSSKRTLRPANELVNAMNELAKGNFKKRLSLGGGKLADNISASFNSLAEELENTEMLRSDFINNFSHEFKTPIVSILGFSRLLKKDCVSESEKREYLDIIEEESQRLSVMATNVLNMTKIENQNILTNITTFNLSEQIRNCVLLLEKKWSQKNLEIDIDFDEYDISANEELLKEVWINLIDNAVKFTPENGRVGVSISQSDNMTEVKISNTGKPIDTKDIDRIFGKFYQGDTSHSSEGTGLGLAIAKKIITLHSGEISVSSDERYTVFTAAIPRRIPMDTFMSSMHRG